MKLEKEINGTNAFLVYEIAEDAVLDNTAMGMLRNSEIKGVLKPNYSQINGCGYLRYAISGKESLTQFFSGKVSRDRLLAVLNSLTDTMKEAEDYLLEVSSFVWNLDYIYVEAESGCTYMICVPVEQEKAQAIAPEQFFRQLLISVLDRAENVDSVARLLAFFNSEVSFSLAGFQNKIREVSQMPSISSAASNLIPTPMPESASRPAPAPNPTPVQRVNPVLQQDLAGEQFAESLVSGASTVPNMNIPVGQPMPLQTPQGKHGGFGLFGRKKLKKNEEQKSDKKKGKDKDSKNVANVMGGIAVPGQVAPVNGTSQPMNIPNVPSPPASPVNSLVQPNNYQNITQPQFDEADKTEYEDDDRTMIDDSVGTAGAWLELLSSAAPGIPAQINLAGKESFMIGRVSKDMGIPDVPIPQDLKRVGRRHAKLELRGNIWYLTDLGSGNKTLLDEQVMAPNQPYPLRENMVIALTASKLVCFRFHG